MERLGRWYPREAAQAKFLLGGIGTGNVSIGPRGQLCDWELMNSPGKGVKIPYTFFALRTRAREETAVRILESEFVPPYECSHGIGSNDSGGIPRFRDSRLRAAVSRAEIELFDNTLPVDVRIEAFSPFIPLDAVSSGMPSFVLRYRVRNTTSAPIEASVCGCLTNPVGRTGDSLFFRMETDGHAVNTHRVEDGLEGIWYASDLPETHLLAGNMALVTTARAGVSVKPRWKRGGWWDGTHDFWNDFISDGMLESEDTGAAEAWGDDKQTYELKTGAVCVKKRLDSGQTQVFEFIISWFFPNRPSNWCGHIFNLCTDKDRQNTIRNFYATQWENAWQAARALNDDMARLERTTDLFIDTLMHSTLPAPLIEAAEANITVLRSTTCFRIEDGTLLGWEGCFPHCGSCEGSCTHVWNYAQTPAFLFPELERSMRRAEYLLETDETGAMAYRGYQALGGPRCDILLPAADGQMGSIIRLYRDWKLSGDDDFLRSLWDKVVLSIEFAMKYWDTDGDLLFDARQRNTYDIEFYGGNPFTQTLFIGALKACGQMARALGDARAVRYDALYQRAAQSMDEALWNGEYYQQKMEGLEGYKYQFGAGCLSDALFGQLLAHVAGLGYLLPEMRVKRAVSAVFRHNFIRPLRNHINVQRTYALNDEAGLVLCSWPNGGRPEIPFVYSDEVWSGVEYQVAAHLLFEGYADEAVQLVKAVRVRQDGFRRNPWNEVECGNHYARSMASWGLLIAASGFAYDLRQNAIGFKPNVCAEAFCCFFSTGKSWGKLEQTIDADGPRQSFEVLWGEQNVKLKEHHCFR